MVSIRGDLGAVKHSYKSIVAYNPSENIVTACRPVSPDAIFDSKASDEAFYDVYLSVDRVTDIVIGISLTGNMYQLSPAAYGTYVKEDQRSMEYINRSRLLVAIADFKKKNRIPFDD